MIMVTDGSGEILVTRALFDTPAQWRRAVEARYAWRRRWDFLHDQPASTLRDFAQVLEARQRALDSGDPDQTMHEWAHYDRRLDRLADEAVMFARRAHFQWLGSRVVLGLSSER